MFCSQTQIQVAPFQLFTVVTRLLHRLSHWQRVQTDTLSAYLQVYHLKLWSGRLLVRKCHFLQRNLSPVLNCTCFLSCWCDFGGDLWNMGKHWAQDLNIAWSIMKANLCSRCFNKGISGLNIKCQSIMLLKASRVVVLTTFFLFFYLTAWPYGQGCWSAHILA